MLNDDSRTMVIRTRDPHEVIKALSDRTDVLLEGGPTLAGAFLRAGVIDRILAYVAPILLGGPITAVDDVGVLSIAHAQRWRFDGDRADRARPAAQPRSGLVSLADVLRCFVHVQRTVFDEVANAAAPSRSRNAATV